MNRIKIAKNDPAKKTIQTNINYQTKLNGTFKDKPVYLSSSFKKVSIQRTGAQRNGWNKMEKLITEKLSFINPNSKKSDEKLLNISHGFKFYPKDIDRELIETHIEPLIDQTADLLDRCLKDRAVWDELSIKMFNLAIELNEYKYLDKIHKEEEAAGLYETAYRQSVAEYNAELAAYNKHLASRNMINNILTTYFNEKDINELHNANRCSAWLGGLVPYNWEGQKFVGYQTHQYGSVTKAVADFYKDNMHIISRHNILLQRETLFIQQNVINSQIESSEKKLQGLLAKSEWDKVNANFQRRRTVISRDLQDIKTAAVINDDGILNYIKRLLPLQERFQNDFRDAVARIKVVENGLLNVYGLKVPAPADEKAVDYYDKCLLWTRQIIQWMIKFSRKEQNTILPISLQQLLSPDDFKNMQEKGLFSFTLTENQFPEMCNIRIRGISLSVKDNSSQKDRLWKFKIIPPPVAAIRHYLTGKTIEFQQPFLDPCVSARVIERESVRTPDVLGITSLYNASPLGFWKIQSLGSIPIINTNTINDIQIDFHLAFRWK